MHDETYVSSHGQETNHSTLPLVQTRENMCKFWTSASIVLYRVNPSTFASRHMFHTKISDKILTYSLFWERTYVMHTTDEHLQQPYIAKQKGWIEWD